MYSCNSIASGLSVHTRRREMSPEAAHTHARDPGLQRYPGNALNPTSEQVVHTVSNAGPTRAGRISTNVVTHEHRAPTAARGRPNPSNPGSQSVLPHQVIIQLRMPEKREKSNRRCRSTQEGDHPRRLVPPERKKIMREEIRGVERTRATSRGYVSCVSYVSEKFPKLQSYSGARNAWPSRATELGCFVVG